MILDVLLVILLIVNAYVLFSADKSLKTLLKQKYFNDKEIRLIKTHLTKETLMAMNPDSFLEVLQEFQWWEIDDFKRKLGATEEEISRIKTVLQEGFGPKEEGKDGYQDGESAE